MSRVFIGVGHGGSDPGAVGHVVEKDAVLTIALEVRRILEAHGIVVGISRTTDEEGSLNKEITMANAFGPDLALEIHANAGRGKGYEAWVQTNQYASESRRAGRCVEERVQELGQESRGLKTRRGSGGEDYFGWLRRVKCPAVLLEGFFVDSDDALDFNTPEKLKRLARAYACGALDYLGVPVKESPFVDVRPDDYFFDAASWAVKRGITAGTAEGRFSPEWEITRVEAAQMIYAYYGKRELGQVQRFDDVAESDWFYKAAHWCRELRITDGIGDNRFGPHEPCTRAQIMQMLWRGAGSPMVSVELPFVDVAESDWFYEAVKWAKASGITSGVDETHFAPDAPCTRAQMVMFLYSK